VTRDDRSRRGSGSGLEATAPGRDRRAITSVADARTRLIACSAWTSLRHGRIARRREAVTCLARALGPALAGAIAAWQGTGIAFVMGALFFTVMIVALRTWKGRERGLPADPSAAAPKNERSLFS
jgi:hypothetical protein